MQLHHKDCLPDYRLFNLMLRRLYPVKRVLLAAFILLGIAFCAAQTAPNLPGPPYTTYTAALDRVALEQQGARVQFPAFTGAAALLSIGINNSHCLGQ